jgi:hypothetical protein
MSLIDDFLDSTSEFESPKSYFLWGFLSAVSGVINNNIYLDRHAFILRPNIFVLLFGKSGLRKALPVSIATDLVRYCNNTRVLSGRSSIQALVTELSNVYHRDGKPPITDAIAFVSAPEFASALVKDEQALTILTDLYDCRKIWKNILKSTGTETLKNLNITLLGGINAPHFESSMGKQNIDGGFIGRTFIILESKRNCINSLVYPTKWSQDKIINSFGSSLLEISNMFGEITFSENAKKYYHDWYVSFSQQDELLDEKQGMLMRLGEHVLKVGVLIATCHGTMELRTAHIDKAIEYCADLSTNAKRVTSDEIKPDPLSLIVWKVLETIYKSAEQRISKKFIVQRLSMKGILVPQINICLNSLNEMGFIFSENTLHDIYYTLSDAGVGASEELFKGDKK